MSVPEITVKELKSIRDNGSDVFVLDVRSQDEFEFANIGADLLVPLGELAERLDELEGHKDRRVVVMCRSGSRSAQATTFLLNNGFTNVANLKGGIRAWSSEIDPGIPMY